MAGTIGAHTSSGFTATSSCALSPIVTQATGSTIVVVVNSNAATVPTGVTDNKGNTTYTQIGTNQLDGGGGVLTCWRFENAAGGSNHIITVNFGAAADPGICAVELVGVKTASYDSASQAQAADAASPYTVTSGTLTQADEIVVVGIGSSSGANPNTFSESSGFTIQDQVTNATLYWSCALATKIVSSTTALTPSFTEAGGAASSLNIAGFMVAPSGPTINTQPASTTKNSGDTATFTISATTSGGTLHYQWKVNGSNVGTDSSSYTTGTLTNSNQWAAITCVVTDDNGSTTSRTAVLTIAFAAAGTGPRRRNVLAAHPIASLGWLGIASSGTISAAASSAGAATDIAVGQSTVAVNALSSAIAIGLAVGAANTAADALSAGSATDIATGSSRVAGDAFTQGTSTALAVGTSSANTSADAFSAGVATDIATGQSTNAADAFTQGAATDIAAGQSTVASDAFTQGTSTALAVGTTSGGATVVSGDGYSAGSASDQAVGQASISADAFTQGTSTALAVGTSTGGNITITADGYSAGVSTARAVGKGGLTGNTVITLGANPWRAKGNQAQVDQENEEIMQLLAQLVPLLSQGGNHHASR